jgi:rhodanese-related sulfurtransferase
MEHSPGFLRLVNQARARVEEISVAEARARVTSHPRVVLLDVREDHEWQAEHAVEARHLGKGILERDIERLIPDPNTEIIMYCGGGYRSVLTAEVALRLGYRHVCSLMGGYKGMKAAGWPMKSGA